MEDLNQAYRGNQFTRKKKDVGHAITKWAIFVLFIVYGLTLLVPFIWMLVSSFKTSDDFWHNIYGIPKEFYGKNLIEVLQYKIQGQTVASMFLVSVVMTVVGTLLNIFFSACAAYVLSKFKFIGRKLIYAVVIFTMIVPIVGTLPAQVQMMETLHLDKNTSDAAAFIGVFFLYSGAFGFNFILLYSSFSSVSNSYLEAASIDGAGRFKTFFKVVLPQVKGSLIACSVLQAIGYWNDYSTPKLFLPRGCTTLAVGLQELQAETAGNYPMLFASMMVAIIPILILYLVFQKRILESTNAGGLKG